MGSSWSSLAVLISRIVSAAISVSAVALFTRLATPEIYGVYIFALAWGFMLTGVTSRWIGETFFAKFRQDKAGGYFAGMLALAAAGNAVAVAAVALGAWLGLFDWRMAFAIALMSFGISAFDLAIEITRAKVNLLLSAATVLLKAVLLPVSGAVALIMFESPIALPVTVALCHLVAALPVVVIYRERFGGRIDAGILRGMLRYGWPLLLASGTWGIAQNIDRLILGHMHGPGGIGAYGAALDFFKQGFFVFGEAIAISLVSIAKRAHTDGRKGDAMTALREAMRSMAAIVVFGVLFVLIFREQIVFVFFGPEFRADVHEVLPILLFGCAVLVMRTYYFGQVIYFLPSATIQAVAAAAQLATTAALALLLVPEYAAPGAAVAFAVGQVVACAVVMLRPGSGFRMPVSMLDVAAICGVGLVVWLVHAQLVVGIAAFPVRIAADLAILAAGAMLVLWAYDLFAARRLARELVGRHRIKGPLGE
jgi:O-antigen/teichoic acid export membrane protein